MDPGRMYAVMTLEQIDADLREWDHKLRVASDNMLELSGSMSYQRLMGEGHWPKVQLSGATADRAQPAIAGLNTLWVYYSLIHDTIPAPASCASRFPRCCRREACSARSNNCCVGRPSNCRRWLRRWINAACWPPRKWLSRFNPRGC